MKLRTYALIAIAGLIAAGSADAQIVTQRQPQSWLGFSYSTQVVVRDGQRRDVTIILDVVDDSPAAAAGLLAGDTLVRVNDLVATESLLTSLRHAVAPGDEVRLRVRRGGGERVLSLRAAERPAEMTLLGRNSRVILIDPDSLRGRISILLDSTRARLEDVEFPDFVIRTGRDGRTLQFGGRPFTLRADSIVARLRNNDSLFIRLDSLQQAMSGRMWIGRGRAGRDSAWVGLIRPDTAGTFRFFGDDFIVTSGGSGIAMLGQRAIAGAQLTEIDSALGEFFDVEDGILVLRAPDSTPAYRAGLRTGDVIVGADGSRVESISELRRIISRGPRAEPVRLEVVRRGARRTIELQRD